MLLRVVVLTILVASARGEAQFQCGGSARGIPATWVNDDYCDCADGSDEPRTAACAHLGASFACRVEGGWMGHIPSALVQDGVCDCCDGADERNAHCPDDCDAQQAKSRAVLQTILTSLAKGAKEANVLSRLGKRVQEHWQRRIDVESAVGLAFQSLSDTVRVRLQEEEAVERRLRRQWGSDPPEYRDEPPTLETVPSWDIPSEMRGSSLSNGTVQLPDMSDPDALLGCEAPPSLSEPPPHPARSRPARLATLQTATPAEMSSAVQIGWLHCGIDGLLSRLSLGSFLLRADEASLVSGEDARAMEERIRADASSRGWSSLAENVKLVPSRASAMSRKSSRERRRVGFVAGIFNPEPHNVEAKRSMFGWDWRLLKRRVAQLALGPMLMPLRGLWEALRPAGEGTATAPPLGGWWLPPVRRWMKEWDVLDAAYAAWDVGPFVWYYLFPTMKDTIERAEAALLRRVLSTLTELEMAAEKRRARAEQLIGGLNKMTQWIDEAPSAVEVGADGAQSSSQHPDGAVEVIPPVPRPLAIATWMVNVTIANETFFGGRRVPWAALYHANGGAASPRESAPSRPFWWELRGEHGDARTKQASCLLYPQDADGTAGGGGAEFQYRFCPSDGGTLKQRSRTSGQSVSLGSAGGWSVPRLYPSFRGNGDPIQALQTALGDEDPSVILARGGPAPAVLLLKGGTWCGSLGSRRTEVFPVCGPTMRIARVEEPSPCRYAVLLVTPAACGPAETAGWTHLDQPT